MYNLEEFPPQRESNAKKPRTKKPPKADRAERPPKADRSNLPRLSRPQLPALALPRGSWFVVTGLLLVGMWFWMGRRTSRLEAQLSQAVTNLESARSAVSLLWTTVASLDSAQQARQVVLRDTVGHVRNYLEMEMERLWESAYHDHRRRLEEHATELFRIDDSMARANAAIQRIDGSITRMVAAAARTDERVAGLARLTEINASDLRTTGDAVRTIRQSLGVMTNQLGELQGQFTLARGEQDQLGNRVEGVESWVAGFDRQGLDARAVQGSLTSLIESLRSMTHRVDSLETVVDSVRGYRTTFRGGQR